ncbi:NADP-dependent oxidoreductase [Rhodococcoides trifolii]|nr:NADP-dependent oxidoreductase [Rhodococcus trifolii]
MNRILCLATRPDKSLSPEHFTILEEKIGPLGPDDVLVRNTWLSIDPSVRLRLHAVTPNGYLPPFEVGEPLVGLALGVVVESRSSRFSPGDTVTHMYGYRDCAVVPAGGGGLGGAGSLTKIETDGFAPQWFLGPLGSSGLTAYVGLVEIIGLQPADVLWVSAAAGAVGSIAAQLAVLRGSTVIASAGNQDKVDYLRDGLGVHSAFDYHSGDVTTLVADAAPDGIDAYFDNVGGDHFDAALANLRTGGRIAMCGAISGYDVAAPGPGPSNTFQITAKSLSIRGFRAGSFAHLYDAMRFEVGTHLSDGSMVHRESVYEELEQAPTALVDLLNGRTTGKTLCRLA